MNKLIEEGKAQVLSAIKIYIINCFSNVYEYEPPPAYKQFDKGRCQIIDISVHDEV